MHPKGHTIHLTHSPSESLNPREMEEIESWSNELPMWGISNFLVNLE